MTSPEPVNRQRSAAKERLPAVGRPLSRTWLHKVAARWGEHAQLFQAHRKIRVSVWRRGLQRLQRGVK